MKKNTTFQVFQNGPIEVSGNFEILDAKGDNVPTDGTVFLCRCGNSANKPFCDGTHKKTGFAG